MEGKTCGMNICKKCAGVNIVFGILFLIAALWEAAPSWLNGWTLIGVYLLLWGLASIAMGPH